METLCGDEVEEKTNELTIFKTLNDSFGGHITIR